MLGEEEKTGRERTGSHVKTRQEVWKLTENAEQGEGNKATVKGHLFPWTYDQVGWAVVAHSFNASTREVEASRSL